MKFLLSLFISRLNSSVPQLAPQISCFPVQSPALLLFSEHVPTAQYFLVVRDPELNTVLKVKSHQCGIQKNNCFPSSAGHTISNASQVASDLLGHLGTPLVHVQPSVDQYLQFLFCYAAFQALCSRTILLNDPSAGLSS